MMNHLSLVTADDLCRRYWKINTAFQVLFQYYAMGWGGVTIVHVQNSHGVSYFSSVTCIDEVQKLPKVLCLDREMYDRVPR